MANHMGWSVIDK